MRHRGQQHERSRDKHPQHSFVHGDFGNEKRSNISHHQNLNPYEQSHSASLPNLVEIYNIPERFDVADVSYMIYKTLERLRGLIKPMNPITRSEFNPEKKCIELEFRSREEALNCFELNGIYYGNRAFYMKTNLPSRPHAFLNLNGQRTRKVAAKVPDGFSKIYIGNLPQIQEYQILDILCTVGQVVAFEPITTSKTQVQCFCEFASHQLTETYLQQLNKMKLKNRSLIAKRASLMNTSETSKTTKVRIARRPTKFQSDLDTYYLTLDTDRYFQNMQISCVLIFKNIISNLQIKDQIQKDIQRELSKVGPIVRSVINGRNIYLEFEKVEYAQIAYLVVSSRRYEGKNLDVAFYSAIHFADENLI